MPKAPITAAHDMPRRLEQPQGGHCHMQIDSFSDEDYSMTETGIIEFSKPIFDIRTRAVSSGRTKYHIREGKSCTAERKADGKAP